jgi:hypothetical protein
VCSLRIFHCAPQPNRSFNADANTGHAFGILLASVGALRPDGLRRRLTLALDVMRTVQLTLPSGHQERHYSLKFGIEVAANDLDTLRKYTEYMTRVRNASILQRGMGGLEGIHFSKERGLEIKSAEWSDAELYELLHVLRLVTLEKESACYKNVAKILHEVYPFENVRAFIDECTRAYDHGEGSIYMQITIGEQPAFDASLLRLWLNGTQYHSDEKKAERWAQLEAAISTKSARALVVSQLHSKTLALLNIDYLAQKTLNEENAV